MGDSIYEINSDKCTECVGHYETPTCQKAPPNPQYDFAIPPMSKAKNSCGDKFVLMHHADKL